MNQSSVNMDTEWAALERRLGYVFRDRTLLCRAFCHRSYVNEHPEEQLEDNERLEYLGDAVLDLLISREQVVRSPDLREGELTRTRAEVVAEASLAELAETLHLGNCLLLGRGELRSGGRQKASLLADTFEALLGAVFLDADLENTAEVFLPFFVPRLERAAGREGLDYKSRLQERLQAMQLPLPVYRLAETTGPDHARRYQVEVLVRDRVVGVGDGKTKKKAEQAAARAALAGDTTGL